MCMITVDRDPGYAPCGYLVCRVTGEPGNYDWHPRADETVLVQSDWEFPALASTFGFVPCECGRTDGTVDCPHKTATQMITEAADWLDEHCGAVFVEDPGYFGDC